MSRFCCAQSAFGSFVRFFFPCNDLKKRKNQIIKSQTSTERWNQIMFSCVNFDGILRQRRRQSNIHASRCSSFCSFFWHFLFNTQFLSPTGSTTEYRLRTLLSRSIYFDFFLRFCHHRCCCCRCRSDNKKKCHARWQSRQLCHTTVASDECQSMFTQIHHSPHYWYREFRVGRLGWTSSKSYIVPKIVINEFIKKIICGEWTLHWGEDPERSCLLMFDSSQLNCVSIFAAKENSVYRHDRSTLSRVLLLLRLWYKCVPTLPEWERERYFQFVNRCESTKRQYKYQDVMFGLADVCRLIWMLLLLLPKTETNINTKHKREIILLCAAALFILHDRKINTGILNLFRANVNSIRKTNTKQKNRSARARAHLYGSEPRKQRQRQYYSVTKLLPSNRVHKGNFCLCRTRR